MKPKNPSAAEKSQLQLFQARLDSQLNDGHPFFVLAGLIDWERFDQACAPIFCPDNGAPALPTRLMVGLEYLKYAYDISDRDGGEIIATGTKHAEEDLFVTRAGRTMHRQGKGSDSVRILQQGGGDDE